MKPEPPFLLECARWPAFVVDAGGNVLQANKAALSTFNDLGGISPKLSSIWAAGNAQTPEYLFGSCEKNGSSPISLRLKANDGEAAFSASVVELPCDSGKRFLIQLSRAPQAGG